MSDDIPVPKRIPVTEAERTPEGARDRFRKVTHRILREFQEYVIGEGYVGVAEAEKVGRELREAADEYHRNIDVSKD